jgi:surfactin synthase thioesterase subunit
MSDTAVPCWFPFPPDPACAGLTRLYCVPPAGSGATLYLPWRTTMAGLFDVWPVQLPGHETRRREAPVARIEPLAEALADAIEAHGAHHAAAAADYALFGHSYGALVAFETVRILQARRAALPVFLAASGSRAPHQGGRARIEDGLAFLRTAGGTPPEVLENEEFMALILPALRADLEAESVYLRTSEARLQLPIAAFGGRADPFVAPEDVASWAAHTAQWCSVALFEGGHFFLAEAAASVRGRLAAVLEQAGGIRTLQ